MRTLAHSASHLEADSTRDDRIRQLHRRVLNVEPEFGPGRLFKTNFLGSHECPLDAEEYRRRLGARFTTNTPALQMQNPVDSRVNLQVEMRLNDACSRVISVLLTRGQGVWMPIIADYVFEVHASPRVIPCVDK